MEQTELVLVIFVCWERGGLYMEIVCVECQGGDYAQGGVGGGVCVFYGVSFRITIHLLKLGSVGF